MPDFSRTPTSLLGQRPDFPFSGEPLKGLIDTGLCLMAAEQAAYLSACQVGSLFQGACDGVSDRIADGRETFVLDVRTPREYDGPLGHIAGSRLIPVQELSRRMQELSGVKDRHIFVICRSGNRSATATVMLREAGFEASNVAGGMQAWKSLAEKN